MFSCGYTYPLRLVLVIAEPQNGGSPQVGWELQWIPEITIVFVASITGDMMSSRWTEHKNNSTTDSGCPLIVPQGSRGVH